MVSLPNSSQVTALYLACWCKAERLALLLLSRGADPNKVARDENGALTPLYMAVWDDLNELVRSLIASGARTDLDTGGGEHLVDQIL